MSDPELGTFYGVGVGPGDPELLTRKAVRILNEVDRVLYPAEAHGGPSFSQRIIAPLNLPEAKCQAVYMGMSRDRATDLQTYETVVDDIAQAIRQGQSVAWITQGDPLFYSTFIHLYEEMQDRFPEVPIEIVPAVTSPLAAAAMAGVPVSRLDEKVAVVPAVYGLEELPALLDTFATVFLMKVNGVFDQLLDTLRCLPDPVQAVYLERVGTPEARMVTDLETLRGQKLPYFSLVLLRQKTRRDQTADTQGTV
jgi:precorrin-2/cobalt-factor-2 C20-methyltransferase